MPGMLSQFSDVQLAGVYQCVGLEIACAAQIETAEPPVSTLRIARLFRLPYLLVDAVVDFKRCGGPLLPDCGEFSHRNGRGVFGFELIG